MRRAVPDEPAQRFERAGPREFAAGRLRFRRRRLAARRDGAEKEERQDESGG
jgi:hypothetical protein